MIISIVSVTHSNPDPATTTEGIMFIITNALVRVSGLGILHLYISTILVVFPSDLDNLGSNINLLSSSVFQKLVNLMQVFVAGTPNVSKSTF